MKFGKLFDSFEHVDCDTSQLTQDTTEHQTTEQSTLGPELCQTGAVLCLVTIGKLGGT